MLINFRSMKWLLLVFLSLCFAVTGCKKKDDNPAVNDLEEMLTTNINLLYNAGVVYSEEFQQSGDSLAAANAMREWLISQSDVSGGWVHNREYFEVEFTNGLKSIISIVPVRENGEHLRRGGGKHGELVPFPFKSIQSREIKNKKALVLIPYTTVFGYGNSQIDNVRNALEANNSEIEVDIEVDDQVELNDLDGLGDYGLIILDVHGVKHGFFLEYVNQTFSPTQIVSAQDVIEAVINEHEIPSDKLENGQIEIGIHITIHTDGSIYFTYTILITEEYIRQLNVDLSNAVLMGNHCYSGHTADGETENNLPEAWRSLGLATYYGYAGLDGTSAPADNLFCRARELDLINGLVSDGDTTGIAHLNASGEEYFELLPEGFGGSRAAMLTEITEPPAGWELHFRQFFDKDYEYESCGEDLIYQGETYRTVCIGNQIWMAENLRYLPIQHTDQEFADASDNETPGYGAYPGEDIHVFGALYNWYAAMDNICPAGWHLPTQEEWQQLASFTGPFSEAGAKLKSQSYWLAPSISTDEYGFSAVGGGERGEFLGDFREIGAHGKYWTSTDVGPGIAIAAGFSYNAASYQNGNTSKGIGKSCRCVKDE